MITGWLSTLRSGPRLSNVCLFLGSVAICLILGEVLLRLLVGRLPGEIRQIVIDNPGTAGIRDPYIGHLHRPNTGRLISSQDFSVVYRTDNYGFRNAIPWPQRAKIVVVGDSLVFGYGVQHDQAWPEVIHRALPKTHLINLGLIGASPEQYFRVYQTYGRKLQPKILLVGFFARNDFWDAALFDRWLRTDRSCNYMVWRDYGRPKDCGNNLRWKARLRLHSSYLFNLSFRLATNIKRQLQLKTEFFQFADGRRLRLDVGDFQSKTIDSQPDRREFQLVLQALQNLHALAEKDGTKMLVVFQPSKEEVYLPLQGETAADLSYPLRKNLTESGIEWLNLTPVFRVRAAMGEKLFFEADGHPNAGGYELIGNTVLARIGNNFIR